MWWACQLGCTAQWSGQKAHGTRTLFQLGLVRVAGLVHADGGLVLADIAFAHLAPVVAEALRALRSGVHTRRGDESAPAHHRPGGRSQATHVRHGAPLPWRRLTCAVQAHSPYACQRRRESSQKLADVAVGGPLGTLRRRCTVRGCGVRHHGEGALIVARRRRRQPAHSRCCAPPAARAATDARTSPLCFSGGGG